MWKTALTLCLVSQAAACVIVDDSYESPAAITARWSFFDLATNTPSGCPDGFDTVAVNHQALDEFGPYGPVIIDLYDCNAVSGTSLLDPAVYETWIDVTSHDRTRLYASSLSSVLDVIDRDATFEAELLNDGGYFFLSWDLIGEVSNRSLACGDASVDSIVATSSSASSTETDTFPCTDEFGVTGGFLAGDYTVSLSAMTGERPVTSEPLVLADRPIQNRNRVTDLGHVSLPIPGN
jgi:hypothetical protein